ncbi:hypothetical protein [Isoptericola dokdonensis]|jgi:hypothetical protein|uniref:Uncharacterized protein n=1 Tax=Isoptericola dokdonensis DS-3 TaxID=1300344 RepID=A0A168F0U4_9MICO|nr:hypothetical protein [Isoptericola dokdonensis]ANC30749.1 hypothetical protein I598_1184 [Isoptericola dokdonensis DS-3]
MHTLESMALYRVVHEDRVADVERERRYREVRRSARRPRPPTDPRPTVRHLWWHGAVERLHHLWSPRHDDAVSRHVGARNVG